MKKLRPGNQSDFQNVTQLLPDRALTWTNSPGTQPTAPSSVHNTMDGSQNCNQLQENYHHNGLNKYNI